MRVIAGRLRGMSFDAPEGLQTRPITDRVKESIFSLLTHRLGTPGKLDGLRVLDVFAGSGSFGIESLSRGAAFCRFVERDRRSLPVLRGNLRSLGLDDVSQIAAGNAWTLRIEPPPDEGAFDVCFVDPPYRDVRDTDRVIDLLDRIGRALAPGGLVVFRREHGRPFTAGQLERLRPLDEREWGDMVVTILGFED